MIAEAQQGVTQAKAHPSAKTQARADAQVKTPIMTETITRDSPTRFLLFLPLALIWGYQRLVSPWLGEHCRFYPSCSEYARQALLAHGLFFGTWLSLKRILRCNSLFEGGLDPVPEQTGRRKPNKR